MTLLLFVIFRPAGQKSIPIVTSSSYGYIFSFPSLITLQEIEKNFHEVIKQKEKMSSKIKIYFLVVKSGDFNASILPFFLFVELEPMFAIQKSKLK